MLPQKSHLICPHHKGAKPRCTEDCLMPKSLALFARSYCQKTRVQALLYSLYSPLSNPAVSLDFRHTFLLTLCQVWCLHPNLSISIGWLPSPSQLCLLHHQALLQTSESSFSPSTACFLVRLLALDTDSLVKIPALSRYKALGTFLNLSCLHFLTLKTMKREVTPMRCFECQISKYIEHLKFRIGLA